MAGCGRCGTSKSTSPYRITPVGGARGRRLKTIHLCDLCHGALEDALSTRSTQVKLENDRPPGRRDPTRP